MPTNRQIAILGAVAVLVLAALPFGLQLLIDVDADDLSRDVADTAKVPWWTGGLAMGGLMMWSAAIGVCTLAAIAISRQEPEQSRFLGGTALLLLLAAIDDALQIHETVLPEEIGAPEGLGYLILGAAALLWAWRFRDSILSSRLWLFAGAAVFFAGSLLSDVLVIGPTAAEDWLKNSGIALLLLWCGDTALQALRAGGMTAASAPRPRREPADATPPPAR